MKRTCSVRGCDARAASGYSPYCHNHKARLRRHGAVDQTGITATQLRPHVTKVKARIAKNLDNPVWEQLDKRWLAVIDHARGIVSVHQAGTPGLKYERKAAQEVVRLGASASPREAVETALAMFLMHDQEPGLFRSDAGFRFQLVRRVRSLSGEKAGDRQTGAARRVHRELSPKVTAMIGQWIAEALGAAGLHIARLEREDEDRRRQEQAEFRKALRELT